MERHEALAPGSYKRMADSDFTDVEARSKLQARTFESTLFAIH